MTQFSYNKASLHKEVKRLRLYQQYLPSLDLKRQQLMGLRAKIFSQLDDAKSQIETCRQMVYKNLPMLANPEIIKLERLIEIGNIETVEENVVGVKIPVCNSMDITIKPYSTYSHPHWVDQAAVQVRKMIELHIRHQVIEKQAQIIDAALKKITQKVNLFDKVLIPKTQGNIRKIHIYLSDAERADIVRAKITKQKRAEKN